MNILVLNGSPKSKNSNTFQITTAFLAGLNANQVHSIEIVDISKQEINHCLGCYGCWTKTPGECVIHDDMAQLIEKYTIADLIIWSFPLYYFSMPSKIKAFVDRLLPTNMPSLQVYDDGTSGHSSRYDCSNQRHILISTCGFFTTKNNYDALFQQFEIMFHQKLTKIICPEGELLQVPQLRSRIEGYLSYVKKAGEEYAFQGFFSNDVQTNLNELLFPVEVFVEMANANWEIKEISQQAKHDTTNDMSYPFLRQMASLYNNQQYTKAIVLEMNFTDLNKTYQLLLGKEKCTVIRDHFKPYTTRIETTFQLWLDISENKVSGSEALIEKRYRVLGDFDVMVKMDDYFGSSKSIPLQNNQQKSSNMLLLLVPFICLWTFMPFDYILAGLVSICACGIVNLLYFWYKPTPYERIGSFAVMMIGLVLIVNPSPSWQFALPSLVSGILWFTSSFMKIPLTAYYSSKDYGGEKAYGNPIFIVTNRILTVVWSFAYFLWGVTEILFMDMSKSWTFNLIVWILMGLLGVFTTWFSKWYPSKLMKG